MLCTFGRLADVRATCRKNAYALMETSRGAETDRIEERPYRLSRVENAASPISVHFGRERSNWYGAADFP